MLCRTQWASCCSHWSSGFEEVCMSPHLLLFGHPLAQYKDTLIHIHWQVVSLLQLYYCSVICIFSNLLDLVTLWLYTLKTKMTEDTYKSQKFTLQRRMRSGNHNLADESWRQVPRLIERTMNQTQTAQHSTVSSTVPAETDGQMKQLRVQINRVCIIKLTAHLSGHRVSYWQKL